MTSQLEKNKIRPLSPASFQKQFILPKLKLSKKQLVFISFLEISGIALVMFELFRTLINKGV